MPTPRRLNFDDLVFQPLQSNSKTTVATLSFPNNYGCRVYHRSFATNSELPYEFELLFNGEHYSHQDVAEDNIGYLSKDDICSLLIDAQKLRHRNV